VQVSHVTADSPGGRVKWRRAIGEFVFVEHEYPRFVERGAHSHPWLHLSIVRRGEYRRGGSTRDERFPAGSVSLLSTEEMHTDQYLTGTRCLHVVIPAALEESMVQEFPSARRRRSECAPAVAAAFSVALCDELHLGDGASPLVIAELIIDLVSRDRALHVERSRFRPRCVSAALELLEEHFSDGWSLPRLAAALDVHPVYLCRTFARHVGCTIGEYVRHLRTARARQLLSLSDTPLAAIAAQCGFADQSHLCRSFRRSFGTTPGRYRRSRAGAPPARRVVKPVQ
jgi:AraC family transcriptional regulator